MPALTTLVEVERDEDLSVALARLSESGPGWFTACGYVSDVELRVPSPQGFVAKQLPGSYALVHLAGVSTGPYFVSLIRIVGDVVESLGGELVRARSLGVHLAAHAGRLGSTPARVGSTERSADALRPPDGLGGSETSASMPRPAAVLPPKPAWAMAAAASARSNAAEAHDTEDPELPEAGDLVDHFAFGRCEVVGSEGDRLRLRDVKPPGRVREVSVEMLRVMPPSEVDGKRLFQLARRLPN